MSAIEKTITEQTGVSPTLYTPLAPRQKRFIELYLDPSSDTFGNCYRSAIGAGFTDQTARNLTHNKPRWYSEIVGQNEGMQPEHLVLKLTEIINDEKETTQNKLKAIDMMMKYRGMNQVTAENIHLTQFNIQNVLE